MYNSTLNWLQSVTECLPMFGSFKLPWDP